MAKIAFIGLGNMGSGMAARLLSAGHSVTVFNRTAAKSEVLARVGARVATTPRQASVGADAVICMVADDDASRAVWVFTPVLRLKDVRYALEFARKLDIGSPFGTLAGRAFQQLIELGAANVNESKVIDVSRAFRPAASAPD